jgi:hypothetical protein
MSKEQVRQEVIDTLLEARYLLNKIAAAIQDDEHEDLMGEAEWLAHDCSQRADSLEMLEYQETMQSLNP